MADKREDRVSPDDFVKFLTEKAPENKCSVCGGESFKITVAPGDDLVLDEFNIPASFGGGHYKCYSILCDNCGLVIPFATHIVDAWVQSKRSKVEGGDG